MVEAKDLGLLLELQSSFLQFPHTYAGHYVIEGIFCIIVLSKTPQPPHYQDFPITLRHFALGWT